ncbi:sigma-54-dependent Fis family transcriptional regulator [Halomonas icarae]|uniref:AAA domain-containing protein n=1 Tax=Halomonas icarae TaxID=2691040 RepID=A0A7X4W1N8_9GAMM|nr:sigma-54-dependent Fis family transcriptional regulator [Halomonas icarae]MDR5903365.1 sigma-54-dependent Fis family transcriptional regulator [Halomonas icarae]NAW14275.1 AAA domain-containing protein [Halomonas icarae]
MTASTPQYPSARDLMDALRFLPEEGQVWLGEQRMLLMSLQASAFFRNELVSTLGAERARGVFIRLGYYSGLQDAELGESLRGRQLGLHDSFLAGPQLHALLGHVKAVPGQLDIDLEAGRFYSEFIWQGSFEVEVWRSRGVQSAPVCWTLLGYASGYATQLLGREVQYREVECLGCGDARCRIIGKLAEKWSDHEAFSSLLREAPLIDELYELQARVATLEGDLTHQRPDDDWGPIGSAPAFREMLTMLDSAAVSEVPVLLLGETGTGKEILARRLHEQSLRAKGPFVAVNCAAIPPELIESELFGVEKGAYTGAVQSRLGRFERAHGGTLFLDELAELSPRAQAALLRALQEHQIERVGGQDVREVDVRVVAATHNDLHQRVAEGAFRRDLFFRLNAFTLTVPPLRDRLEDIPTLADHFLAGCEHHYQRRTLGFSDQARSAMAQYTWPGNVRELKNTIERGVILTADQKHITERALFGDYRVPTLQKEKGQGLNDRGQLEASTETPDSEGTPRQHIQALFDAGLTLEDIEREMLIAAQEESEGNIAAAARRLGMTRPAYAYRLKKYALR